ncbi:MAG: CRISPR-associated endonuclease Cas2 [Clostridia bacterium]|nr:CRISPR-associated endonuclease Cas2 [Clostridia bacterium]
MRMIVFFDLPMETSKNVRDYNAFRKYLIKQGFIMMQKSVYTKLIMNNVAGIAVKKDLYKNLPPKGLVEILEITENQFSRIEYAVGDGQKEIVDSMERIVEI